MSPLRQQLLALARAEAERHYNPQTRLCLIPRETAWYAMTLLASRAPTDWELANRLLEQLEVRDGTHSPCTLLVIWNRFAAQLTAAAQNQILENLRENLAISTSVRYSDGNVNHPLAAMVNLLLSGELLNLPIYAALGKRELQNFQQTIATRQHQHYRQAEMSEYNSPTYSALTLWFLAIAAELAQDSEARELAQFLESRLWLNLALHWHQPSQQFIGPFSRAYAEDSSGGFSALHCTLAVGLETEIFFEPELARRFQHPSALIQNALLVQLKFHVPPAARLIAFEKPFPYYIRMTTYGEQYHENARRLQDGKQIATFDPEVYPGGWSELTTYLTAEYGLGTATRPYVNAGQSDSFSLRYRRAPVVQRLQDFRGVYSRLVFNGAVAGAENFCHVGGFPVGFDYLYEEGRAFTFQHAGQAIVGYTPKRVGHRGVTELRLDLIFSNPAPFDQLWIGNRLVSDLPCTFSMVETIIIQDFQTYLAIFPLDCSGLATFQPYGRIWTHGDLLMLSFFNYHGPQQDFTRAEMDTCRNGFACLLATTQEHPDLSHFRAYLKRVKVIETVDPSQIRNILLTTPAGEMNLCYDPRAERILQRTWNGSDAGTAHFEIQAPAGTEPVFLLTDLYTREISRAVSAQ
ncbi:hypothetical protein L0128_13665 [candidate division KSB1 bacterium]|nr:hypothetical protein [candidate division KSB1 bacterium]